MGETIWLYWENLRWMKRRPPFLDLCLETLRLQSDGLSIEVLDKESGPKLVDGLDLDIWNGLPSPVFRADYLRSRLVHAHGGIWTDIDCIAMQPMTRLLAMLEQSDFAGWAEESVPFTNNLFAARPGALFLERWAAGQDKVIRDTPDLSQLPYHALGRHVTDGVASDVPFRRIPRHLVAPVSWFEWRRFLSKFASPMKVLAQNPITVVLYNGALSKPLREFNAEELLERDMLISRLFRIALGRSKLTDEQDGRTRLHVLSDIRYSRQGRLAELRSRNVLGLSDN
jgi:hypothetical protein